MSLTEAGLCNLALVRIGQRGLIDSLTENTIEAQVAGAVYESARDAVLEAFWWPFATERSELALVVDGERDGWEYAYAVPSPCVAPRYIWSGVRNPAREARIPFAIEHDAVFGRVLLTDQEDAQLIFTARVDVVALFPPLFVQALAWKLAAELALGLSVKPQVGMVMEQKYEAAVAVAAAVAFRDQQDDVPLAAESIRARV